jgi:hypothetical protein
MVSSSPSPPSSSLYSHSAASPGSPAVSSSLDLLKSRHKLADDSSFVSHRRGAAVDSSCHSESDSDADDDFDDFDDSSLPSNLSASASLAALDGASTSASEYHQARRIRLLLLISISILYVLLFATIKQRMNQDD